MAMKSLLSLHHTISTTYFFIEKNAKIFFCIVFSCIFVMCLGDENFICNVSKIQRVHSDEGGNWDYIPD
jgi:hypothetical protein